MSSLTNLRLPSEAVKGCGLLGRLDPQVVEQLAGELESQLRTSFSFMAELSRVLTSSSVIAHLSAKERELLADTIIGLQYLTLASDSDSTAAFINDLVSVVKESSENELAGEELVTLAGNAGLLLEPRPIRASVKAYELRTEHANVLLEAQVFTDIRPVFDFDLTKPLLASLITHTIKFSFQSNERNEALFFAADSQDIELLQKETARALEKAAALTSLLGGHGDRFGPTLDPKVSND